MTSQAPIELGDSSDDEAPVPTPSRGPTVARKAATTQASAPVRGPASARTTQASAPVRAPPSARTMAPTSSAQRKVVVIDLTEDRAPSTALLAHETRASLEAGRITRLAQHAQAGTLAPPPKLYRTTPAAMTIADVRTGPSGGPGGSTEPLRVEGVIVSMSGFQFDCFTFVLFPPDLPKARWLEYVIAEFGGIELNYSFYAGRQCWDSCAIFKSWRRRLPRGSSVTVKAPRELTHGYTSGQYRPNVALTAARRDEWLPKLLRGARKLGSKMGVMLLQFSSSFKKTDTTRRNLRSTLRELSTGGFRIAVELRHESWYEESTYELLRRYNVALVIAHGSTGSKKDANGHVEQSIEHDEITTADFVYVRLHGTDKTHRFRGAYSPRLVKEWHDRIRDWREQGLDVYVFTNNTDYGEAVRTARQIRDRLR